MKKEDIEKCSLLDFKKCSLLDFEYKSDGGDLDISGNVDFELDVEKVTNDEKDMEKGKIL